MACANVSQLLTLFGENSEENIKRIKYSKWKAVTIAKEAKSGDTNEEMPATPSGYQSNQPSYPNVGENLNPSYSEVTTQDNQYSDLYIPQVQPSIAPKKPLPTVNQESEAKIDLNLSEFFLLLNYF